MADKKITELTPITGANLADDDEFVVVDISADENKSVTRSEVFSNTPDILVGTNLNLASVLASSTPFSKGAGIDADGFGVFSRDSVPLFANRPSTDGVVVQLRRSGVAVGSISVTSSTTTYNTTSDRRLKKNITSLTGDSGAKIDSLKPREYDWKSEGNHAIGFIADEFQEVFPSSVTGSPDGEDMQQIDASSPEVIATLVAELQSLRKRVAELENTL